MGIVVTQEQWIKANIITNFLKVTEEIAPQLKNFVLKPISFDDLDFTGEIEDDRINSTLCLKDYDWMSYTWDTRFPTKDNGTLAIRFEYLGSTYCSMGVKQYLPDYLIGLSNSYIKYYKVKFLSSVWDKYLNKELESRIKSADSAYAYNSGEILLDFYNQVLKEGILEEVVDILDVFDWEYVRVPKDLVKYPDSCYRDNPLNMVNVVKNE